jgi:glycosyltransferase involved in cell wall biosynthesis
VSGIIVHDWISKTGGAEKVLDAMVETLPDAEIWCLWNDVPESRYPGRIVRESWLARTPLRRAKAAALPLMPLTWRTHRSTSAEWILASSHVFAHQVSLGGNNADVRKFAYVHTPARYVWTPELDARGAGWLPRLVSPALRGLDRRRAEELYKVAANSEFVRERIQVAWNRDSEVIYPPVDVAQIQSVESWADDLDEGGRALLDRLPRPFVLGASRFVHYKRLDVVIKTGEAMDVPVVLAGSGPEERRLREQAAQATVPVHFVHAPSDTLLYALYEAALVFVFPTIEDFGIMPVEAMATGTPVIGRRVGGVSETVIQGVTGALLDTLDSPTSLADAANAAMSAEPGACRARARVFDSANFSETLRNWMGVRLSSEGSSVGTPEETRRSAHGEASSGS